MYRKKSQRIIVAVSVVILVLAMLVPPILGLLL